MPEFDRKYDVRVYQCCGQLARVFFSRKILRMCVCVCIFVSVCVCVFCGLYVDIIDNWFVGWLVGLFVWLICLI